MPSLGGRFSSAYPLYDGTNRMLVSWSPCLVWYTATGDHQVATPPTPRAPTSQLAPPQYTLWIYDFDAGTLSPMLGAEPGTMIVEPVIMQARTPAPTFIPDFSADRRGRSAEHGHQRRSACSTSAASMISTASTPRRRTSPAGRSEQATFYQRPYALHADREGRGNSRQEVRKIDDSAFGPAGMGMREILGYAPIQPDGSVQIQVPANVPFTVDVARREREAHHRRSTPAGCS